MKAAENAKTSEYAFFKKLKEDASHKDHSCCKSKKAYQARNSKSGDSSRGNHLTEMQHNHYGPIWVCPPGVWRIAYFAERIDMVQNKSQEVRSAVIDKGDSLDKCESFHALPGSASRNSGIQCKEAGIVKH